MSATAVSSGDRLSFTIFVAVVLHAILIFGIAFTVPRIELPNVMEVTLAQHRSTTADKDADFLAHDEDAVVAGHLFTEGLVQRLAVGDHWHRQLVVSTRTSS